MIRVLVAILLMGVVTTSCRSMRMGGNSDQKRHVLKSNVEKARDEQKKVSDEFVTALDQLRALYGDSGTDLEKTYDNLQRVYERCKAQTKHVGKRIDTMDTSARNMFNEWEAELHHITNEQLRANSAEKLRDTRQRYLELSQQMHDSSRRMEPILVKLNDQMLFLKHNLNAQALGTLQGEAQSVEAAIEQLISEMNQAINEANAFIDQL